MGKSLISIPSWVNRLCKPCFFFPQLVQPFQPFQSTEKVPDRVGVCGDGKVQAGHGEECDDGNQIVTDACLSELNATLAHLIALKTSDSQIILISLFVTNSAIRIEVKTQKWDVTNMQIVDFLLHEHMHAVRHPAVHETPCSA